MWLFLPEAFISVACARKPDGSLDPDTVMLRARRKDHLQNLQKRFADIAAAEIRVTPRNDYRYRVVIPKAKWAEILSELVLAQDYSNFKNEAARYQGQKGAAYIHALHEVWNVMHRLQERPVGFGQER